MGSRTIRRTAAMEEQQHPPVLLTVPQFSERHPAFTQPAVRHHIWKSRPRKSSLGEIKGNGLDRAIVRVGRKVLIDEAKFFEWLTAQNAHEAG